MKIFYHQSLVIITTLLQLVLILPISAQPQPSVIVYKVSKQKLFNEIEALGTLKANETVKLTATVTDTITNIYFDDGQRVDKGFLLAEMTNQEESALVKENLARVEEAKKQYDRVKNLPQRGAISGSLVDQRRREFESAQAQLEATKSRLEERLIIAPFAGVMGLRNVSVGALVTPGDEIGTIIDDQQMNLDFSVPAVLLSSLSKGLKVISTTSAYPNLEFEGKIVAIDSQVDPVTRSLIVRAEVPNTEGLLKPGLLMNVVVQYDLRENLLVPEEAIVPSGQKVSVYVVGDDMKVKQHFFTPGVRKNGMVEILSGVPENSMVVTHGVISISEGQQVKIQAVQKENEGLKEILKNLEKA